MDTKVVEKLAHLARLEISDTEAAELNTQLSKILEYFKQVSAVSTKDVEPMITPCEIEQFWREDEVVVTTPAEDLLTNAPEKVGNLFKVPPVV